MSLARRSSRFSRSSALSRSRSTVLRSLLRLCARSAWRTHFRSVSAVHPILAAMETSAAHCDSYSAWCSNTSRTARSRTSGEYLVDVFITPSSQGLESPGIPGRFNRGDMQGVETLLVSQAYSLDSIFHRLAQRAQCQENSHWF